MPQCDTLAAGALLITLGLFLFYRSAGERHKARLLSTLPLSPCGGVQEGLVCATGRAVSSVSVHGSVLGIPFRSRN